MAENKKVPVHDDFVSKVVKDPKLPPDTQVLTGFVGKSSEDGYTRFYTDANLRDFVDIPDDAILHSEKVSPQASPLGGSHVWIDRNAEVIYGTVGPQRAKAKFFQGPIAAQAAAGAGPAPLPPSPAFPQCPPSPVPLYCPSPIPHCPQPTATCPMTPVVPCPTHPGVNCPPSPPPLFCFSPVPNCPITHLPPCGISHVQPCPPSPPPLLCPVTHFPPCLPTHIPPCPPSPPPLFCHSPLPACQPSVLVPCPTHPPCLPSPLPLICHTPLPACQPSVLLPCPTHPVPCQLPTHVPWTCQTPFHGCPTPPVLCPTPTVLQGCHTPVCPSVNIPCQTGPGCPIVSVGCPMNPGNIGNPVAGGGGGVVG
jgi:hypothetical protein